MRKPLFQDRRRSISLVRQDQKASVLIVSEEPHGPPLPAQANVGSATPDVILGSNMTR